MGLKTISIYLHLWNLIWSEINYFFRLVPRTRDTVLTICNTVAGHWAWRMSHCIDYRSEFWSFWFRMWTRRAAVDTDTLVSSEKPINGNRQRDTFPCLTEILLLFTGTRLIFCSQPTQNCNTYTTKTNLYGLWGISTRTLGLGKKINLFDLGAASSSVGFKCQ